MIGMLGKATVTAATVLFVSYHAQAAQPIFVGISYDADNQQNHIISIDGNSGATSTLNTVNFSGGGYDALSPAGGRDFYVLSSAGTLYDFNAKSGHLISTVAVASPVQTFTELPSGLVGIGYNSGTQKNYIVSINATSGATTVLNTFNFDSGAYNGQIISGTDGDFYMLSSGGTLYDFSATSGQILSTTSVSYPVQLLTASPSGLVVIGYDTGTQQNQIVSINATTGAATVLNSFKFDSGAYDDELVSGQYDNFYTLSSGGTLYDFDAKSGQILSTTSIFSPLQNFEEVSGVPEPQAYAIMLLGFGGLGSILRRRRALSLVSHASVSIHPPHAAAGKAAAQIIDTDGDRIASAPGLTQIVGCVAELSSDERSEEVLSDEKMLSIQAAADLLNISRQYMGRLIDVGELAAVKVGSHRRVRAAEIADYKSARDVKRSATLDRLVELSEEVGGYGFAVTGTDHHILD